MIGKLFKPKSPEKKQVILVTNPKPGQALRTACGRGRIVLCDDSAIYRYLLIWDGVARRRIHDLYLSLRIMEQFGATFNSDEMEWA